MDGRGGGRLEQATHHQTLEEGVGKVALSRLLTHDHRAKLAVVADQDELLGAQHHGHHALWLRGLHALINKNGGELHLG